VNGWIIVASVIGFLFGSVLMLCWWMKVEASEATKKRMQCRAECYEGGTGGRVHYCGREKGHEGDCDWDLTRRGDKMFWLVSQLVGLVLVLLGIAVSLYGRQNAEQGSDTNIVVPQALSRYLHLSIEQAAALKNTLEK